jgi:hypothetical protein
MLVLFEDLIESSSESILEEIFQIFETPILRDHLLQDQDATLEKKLQSMVSKICKTVIKKLSVTHDTQFRGKVQSFITAAFPLTHPSGLNRSGLYNTSNKTICESIEEIKQDLEQQANGVNHSGPS